MNPAAPPLEVHGLHKQFATPHGPVHAVRDLNLTIAAGMAEAWANEEIELVEVPVADWSPQATIHFINSLPAELSDQKLAELDAGWGLSESSNAERGRAWFIQFAERRYTDAYDALEAHLNRYGRGRLIAPVYYALAMNGEDRELAREMFERARGAYHPITVGWIAGGLGDEDQD